MNIDEILHVTIPAAHLYCAHSRLSCEICHIVVEHFNKLVLRGSSKHLMEAYILARYHVDIRIATEHK